MRISNLFSKTVKETSQSDVSRNAQLLVKAGYVNRLMAGVYSYLPLGLRTLNNIENIIREEMNSIGGQEILMPALQPREIWDATGRWDKVDVLFKLKGQGDRDLALGPTHEEVVTPLVANFLQSYRDLPMAVYQIQTKFRNEPRAKSGLLRGREFRMKDMYSFHSSEEDLDSFYKLATDAYMRIYKRCGLGDITLLTYASGGVFSKYSHEFQTITPYGEDTVYKIPGTSIAVNKEIIEDRGVLAELIPNYQLGDENKLEEHKAIEVGNIFKLSTRFSKAFEANFTNTDGAQQSAIMGCYGIGPSRIMGTIAECLSDEKGLVWSDEIAPFKVHLVSLARNSEEASECEEWYDRLNKAGISVLYDDRLGIRAGEKLADADLLGMPNRIVISQKTISAGVVELKLRASQEAIQVPYDMVIPSLK